MSDVSSPRLRRTAWLIVLLLLLLAVAIWYGLFREEAAAPPSVRSAFSGPVPVRAVTAGAGTLDMRLPAIGTVTPLRVVTVRSQVDGILERVHFDEGQRVGEGDLLAEIDARPYRVRLAQAKGQQRQNAAQLQNAQADLARYRTLFKQDSIARQQLESQEALVRQYQGVAQSNQAAIDEAQLQLDYTRIAAPLTGRIGLRKVDAGNLISAGDAEGLAVIAQTQPISVLFSVPETQIAPILAAKRAGRPMAVELWDRAERNRLAMGSVEAVDNLIDPATGTLRLRALVPNDDEALFPNQFVNVRLQVDTLRGAVVIPLDAVQYGSRGTYIYVVDAQDKARVRQIELGPTQDGRVAVQQGLDAGELVVLEGLDRLSDGRAVQVMPEPATDKAAS